MNPSCIKKNKAKNISANTKLTAGPAIEIFPFLSLLTLPLIITAPGAANTTPKNEIIIEYHLKKKLIDKKYLKK